MASLVKAGYWVCGPNSLPVQDIRSELFTHLYVGFANVNPTDGSVTIPSSYKSQFKSFTTIVRKRNPQVTTLLSIGGDKAAEHISQVMRDESKRRKFIKDSITLAMEFNFQGLDLCWLYPSSSVDDANLDSFLKEWHAAVRKDLLPTAAVFHHPVNYPCGTVNEKLNWINVLAIDFYTPANSMENTGPIHAWSTRDADRDKRGKDGIENWIDQEVSSQKLVLCLPFYGYGWVLHNLDDTGFFALSNPATTNPIPYRAIKTKLQTYSYEYDKNYIAPHAYNSEKRWIAYEDESSITGKVNEAIRKYDLGGYFAWGDVGADDEKWTLSKAAFNACA